MTGLPAPHLTPDDIDGWLAGAPGPAVQAHLDECPVCRAFAEEERALVARLAAVPLFTPRADFAARVMAAVQVPDPFAIRSLAAARRRLFATRKSIAIAASIALLLVGSMAASALWTLANQDTLIAAGNWLAAEAGRWAWVGLRGAALNLLEEPWYGEVRGLVDTPARLALLSALASVAYVSGVLALRRLLAIPAQRVAHAAA
jgi:predicted anti-sigma-YlaC factor YlaD